MKYLSKSFSTGANSKEYRDNWEDIFGKKMIDNCPEDIIDDCPEEQKYSCIGCSNVECLKNLIDLDVCLICGEIGCEKH